MNLEGNVDTEVRNGQKHQQCVEEMFQKVSWRWIYFKLDNNKRYECNGWIERCTKGLGFVQTVGAATVQYWHKRASLGLAVLFTGQHVSKTKESLEMDCSIL